MCGGLLLWDGGVVRYWYVEIRAVRQESRGGRGVSGSRVEVLGTKWVSLAPNLTNLGIFQIRFQYILTPNLKKFRI